MMYLGFLLLFINALYFTARVEYTCKPYPPEEDCQTGIYEISIYEHDYERAPIAKVESHCVKLVGDRLRAETGRFIAYSTSKQETEQNGPIKDVQYFEEQDFARDNAEVCKF